MSLTSKLFMSLVETNKASGSTNLENIIKDASDSHLYIFKYGESFTKQKVRKNATKTKPEFLFDEINYFEEYMRESSGLRAFSIRYSSVEFHISEMYEENMIREWILKDGDVKVRTIWDNGVSTPNAKWETVYLKENANPSDWDEYEDEDE